MSDPVSARQDGTNYIASVGPDVCWTRIGDKVVPVAYNSIVTFARTARTSRSVRNNGNEDFQVNSRPFNIKGHEAGTLKGVAFPGHVKAYATVRKGSSTVFSEGWQVVRDGDPAWINRPDPGPTEPQRSESTETIEHW